MKKITVILLSVIMLLLPFSSGVSALAAPKAEDILIENPLYSGESNAARPLMASASEYTESSVAYTFQNKKYYTLGKELYKVVKQGLDDRKSVVTVHYLSKTDISNSYSALSDLLGKLFLGGASDEISDTCTDGDYIRWAVSAYGYDDIKRDTKKNGYYFYTLKLQYNYYDTAEEEKQVDKAVNAFVSSFDTNGKSDVEILRAVQDYICSRTTYDYPAADDPYSHLYAFSPYGALVKGKCVCQGYATAFYRLCKELGYNVRVVSSDPNRGCHAWNIVELDGKYYFIDLTWDDQIIDEKIEGMQKYAYFLVNYKNVQKYDSFFGGAHKLYGSYYDTSYFYDHYKQYFSDYDYDFEDTSQLSSCTVSLSQKTYPYNGAVKTPAVTVKDANGNLLNNGTDYTYSYSANKNAGNAMVSISATGDYSGKTQRNFLITPPSANGLKISKVTDSTALLTWNQTAGAPTGYAIELYKNGAWKTIATSSSNSITLTSLSPAAKQTLRVRPYKAVSKRNLYGGYSNTAVQYTKPKKAALKKLTSAKKSLTLKWKSLQCDGYEIQYSTNKNMKGAKTVKAGAKASSKTIKKLKKGKKYYVRIRAYKKYTNASGKAAYKYGAWSTKKSVKCK